MSAEGKAIYDRWDEAIKARDVTAMAELILASPKLINQGIIHYRGNGTTFQTLPLNLVNNSLEATKLLIEHGADPNEYGDGHVLALHNASLEVTKYLLSKGAEVNRIGYEECTPIMYEVYMHNYENVEVLIEHGAQVAYQRKLDGYTSLHWAARKGDLKMVQLLLKHGAPLNARNDDYKRPIDVAQEHGHQAIVAFLKRE